MDTETMIRELECVEEKHKHDEVFTGQLNIAEMVHDVRKRLEELKPYEDTGLTPDQIEVLKKRDTGVKPRFLDGWDTCGNCGERIMSVDRFCSECGQRLKWEE